MFCRFNPFLIYMHLKQFTFIVSTLLLKELILEPVSIISKVTLRNIAWLWCGAVDPLSNGMAKSGMCSDYTVQV